MAVWWDSGLHLGSYSTPQNTSLIYPWYTTSHQFLPSHHSLHLCFGAWHRHESLCLPSAPGRWDGFQNEGAAARVTDPVLTGGSLQEFLQDIRDLILVHTTDHCFHNSRIISWPLPGIPPRSSRPGILVLFRPILAKPIFECLPTQTLELLPGALVRVNLRELSPLLLKKRPATSSSQNCRVGTVLGRCRCPEHRSSFCSSQPIGQVQVWLYISGASTNVNKWYQHVAFGLCHRENIWCRNHTILPFT